MDSSPRMGGTGARRVLVIEDDDAIRALIREVLADDGYDVHEARTGNDALTRVGELRPDVILLDKLMPDGDGTSFAREYATRKGSHAPIVALSAAADASDWASRIGAAAYLAKPLAIEDLLSVVRTTLEKAR